MQGFPSLFCSSLLSRSRNDRLPYSRHLSWIDAFLNASMILTGMGPVDHLETQGRKLFAALYALFSGISFLTFAGLLFAPVYHRFLHKLRLDIKKD